MFGHNHNVTMALMTKEGCFENIRFTIDKGEFVQLVFCPRIIEGNLIQGRLFLKTIF